MNLKERRKKEDYREFDCELVDLGTLVYFIEEEKVVYESE